MSNLNQLSEAELSAVFAVEVAGWIPLTKEWCEQHMWAWPRYKWATPNGYPYDGDAIFATSMDAVLPYLEKQGWAELLQWDRVNGKSVVPRWCVRVLVRGSYIEGTSSTLPRAACIALILAARAEKEAAK